MDFNGDEDSTRYALEKAIEEHSAKTSAAGVPLLSLPAADIARTFLSELRRRGFELKERRTPVQAEASFPAGTVSWREHLKAFEVYAEKYGNDQSAERIAERGGFGYAGLKMLLGHVPRTWAPR